MSEDVAIDAFEKAGLVMLPLPKTVQKRRTAKKGTKIDGASSLQQVATDVARHEMYHEIV
jgi:hypothetical protein